ncbi:acetylmuramic acid-6-phosphate etherase [Devosia limi DSM 17137]|uniref:Acetylmuramic acid-6-phosphate etherase n=1 Tax=Devosia limi DSM 17137 TaxID=1121477 RepID=A0A0F5LTS3_9HYPH|nr:N-acetylmuramic acid 6-phosphate etherase [Devosia limi]KKB85743.1 acetylmuramic acid-6-phosphate etherase [Devosia limi DSM 17137]SHE30877.1 N-acetylmuramic acid 6-phosphate etherase [Devosia limi DSM 17137]
MTATQTERRHDSAEGFDLKPPQEALQILAQAQVDAAASVQGAVPEIAAAAKLAAACLADGGQLVYAAAGSSGMMALADALELPGTYGIARERIKVLLAGGVNAVLTMPGAAEDDEEEARAAMAGAAVGPRDCVIAVTASGSTPYPMAAVKAARAVGASTIGIANNRGAALFDIVDVAICLPTPPEVIAGSTRMGAGTAQKIALNMLSTQMAVHLGHVHDGYMVNLLADNIKLQARARRIVMAVTAVSEARADAALQQAEGAVKTAILLAAGAENARSAQQLLADHQDRLRPSLAALHQGRR